MKKSITQEAPYGCGIACFAFVAGITYAQAADLLGEEQAKSNRFTVKHLREELNRYGLNYISKHVKHGQAIEPKEVLYCDAQSSFLSDIILHTMKRAGWILILT